MKKLVFASLVGSMAIPALGSAQDAPAPVDAAPTPVADQGHQEMSAGHPVEESAEVEEGSWTDRLTYNIFADTFYMVDWNRPDISTAATSVPHRAYEHTDGFGLAFAGVDAMYMGEHFGATVSLRYGVGASRYLIGGALVGPNGSVVDPADPTVPAATIGATNPALSALKQAYGSIMPTEGLTIDVGLFDTIYGAEVADSWVNFNYSRSPLNYLMQPFYHLGVRAAYQVTDSIVVKGLISNSTNAYTGLNGGLPYFGGQVGYTSDVVNVYAGYMTGQPGVASSRTDPQGDWEHFVDVVATVSLGDFSLVGNFDLWKNPSTDPGYGFSVVAAYQITDMLGVAARFDYIAPVDPYWTNAYDQLIVGTATLDFRPWDDNVILRLEHRFEAAALDGAADANIYLDNDGLRDTWMSTTLSAVIRTGN